MAYENPCLIFFLLYSEYFNNKIGRFRWISKLCKPKIKKSIVIVGIQCMHLCENVSCVLVEVTRSYNHFFSSKILFFFCKSNSIGFASVPFPHFLIKSLSFGPMDFIKPSTVVAQKKCNLKWYMNLIKLNVISGFQVFANW